MANDSLGFASDFGCIYFFLGGTPKMFLDCLYKGHVLQFLGINVW